MHTVMWTFKVPAGTSKAQLVETINATAHTYEGIPGLIRKYYGIAPDGSSLVGIYLWESQAAANAFTRPTGLRWSPSVGQYHRSAKNGKRPWLSRAPSGASLPPNSRDGRPSNPALAPAAFRLYFTRCQTCTVAPLPRDGVGFSSLRSSLASVSTRF